MFGILNLHKPAGVTSRDVVNVVQRLVKPVKVGHAGTLDPMATGVLLVCVGKATKLISRIQKSTKTYEADFVFGQRSDTDDSTGNVEECPVESVPETQDITTTAARFLGTIDQVPPAFSAVKVEGRRAYAKARQGETFELQPKQVTIHSMKMIEYEWPTATFQIECGSGTYIRSLARDLGDALGCGGLMSRLVRTKIGTFPLDRAVPPEQIAASGVETLLDNPLAVVEGMLQYRCSVEEINHIAAGRAFSADPKSFSSNGQLPDDIEVALISNDASQLVAFAELNRAEGVLQPRTVFLER